MSGSVALRDGEIVIDEVFARKERLTVGDNLTIKDNPFRIIGVARGGNCFLYQYAFVTLAQAKRLFGMDRLSELFPRATCSRCPS